MRAALARSLSMPRKLASTSAKKVRPSGVGTIRLRTRSNSAKASDLSSSAISRLMPGWVTPRISAAREMVPAFITAAKTSIWRLFILMAPKLSPRPLLAASRRRHQDARRSCAEVDVRPHLHSVSSLDRFGWRLRAVDRLPVVLHIDDQPAPRRSFVQGLVELSDMGLAIIGIFPLGVGVVNDEREARAGVEGRPLQHLQIAVGVAGGED